MIYGYIFLHINTVIHHTFRHINSVFDYIFPHINVRHLPVLNAIRTRLKWCHFRQIRQSSLDY